MSAPFRSPVRQPKPRRRRIAREVRRQLRRRFPITSQLALSDIVASAESSSTSGTSKSVTLPTSGVSVGMLMVIAIAITDADTTPPTLSEPGDWNLVGGGVITTSFSSPRLYFLHRIIDSVDASLSITASDTCGHVAQAVAIQNAAWGQISTFANGSSTSNTTNALTAASGSLILAGHACDDGDDLSSTPPTDFTDQGPSNETTITTPGNGVDIALSARTWSGGSTGGITRSQADDEWGNYLVEIEHSPSEGISSVTPSSFNLDNADIDIAGANFEASQGGGTVYFATADTLAGGSEVDIGDAIQTWADDNINLDLTALSSAQEDAILALGTAALYVIVVNDSSDEYASDPINLEARPVDIADADVTLDVDTPYRWYFSIENTGATGPQNFRVQYRINTGGGYGSWTNVAGTVINPLATDSYAHDSDVPQSLSGSGTYISDNNAAMETDALFELMSAMAAGGYFNGALNFEIPSEDVSNGDLIQLRITEADGTALDAYSHQSTITVSEGGAPAGGVKPPSGLLLLGVGA